MRAPILAIKTIVSALLIIFGLVATARATGDIRKVNHIVVVMQENHSFDNYFGVLPYVSGSPYHHGECSASDHLCVDGLSCMVNEGGAITCSNSNPDANGNSVTSFHEGNYCVGPDLDHSWAGAHAEANFEAPNNSWRSSPNDGFVRQNNLTEQPGGDDTMGFYTSSDLPFYYSLAETFAIDDRYFSAMIGPTNSNRLYEMAGTSFGHIDGNEQPPAGIAYQPIRGSIFGLLDKAGVSWVNYFSDTANSMLVYQPSSANLKNITDFSSDAAGGTLPQVAFVDPTFGGSNPTDEHPPYDIRVGQYFVSGLVNAVRNGPNWKDTVIFITWDEDGGFYDHVAPARAPEPDKIYPGLCADRSNPPSSELLGGGAYCDLSVADAEALCPAFTGAPTYPVKSCAVFKQLGFRVPFITVSPFAKPDYVSHRIANHTSLLAFIEKRFLSSDGGRASLTPRDRLADTLEDLFDFNHSPSADAVAPSAPAPSSTDPGCPFNPADSFENQDIDGAAETLNSSLGWPLFWPRDRNSQGDRHTGPKANAHLAVLRLGDTGE